MDTTKMRNIYEEQDSMLKYANYMKLC